MKYSVLVIRDNRFVLLSSEGNRKGSADCTDNNRVRLDSENVGALKPVIRRSLIISIDSKSCNIPSGTGGDKALGPSSGWPNKLNRKYNVCSSTRWLDQDLPKIFWEFQGKEWFRHNVALEITKTQLIGLIFNPRFPVCCDPERFMSVFRRCPPIGKDYIDRTNMEAEFKLFERVVSGESEDWNRPLHTMFSRAMTKEDIKRMDEGNKELFGQRAAFIHTEVYGTPVA